LMKSTFGPSSYVLLRDIFTQHAIAIITAEISTENL
jgi:hypothetical protein